MTLRELINSVDSEQYSDSSLYQKLRETKPEYGANRRIQVKLMDGKEVYRASQFIDLEELKYNINRYIELQAQ